MATAVMNRMTQVSKNGDGHSPGNFLRALAHNDRTEIAKSYGVEKSALNEFSGAEGGYLVPPGYSLNLMEAWAEFSFIRPRAMIVEMNSKQTFCPYVDAETVQDAGASPFFGGMKVTWGNQGTVTEETEPKFRQLELNACDLIAVLVLTNQFIDDIGPAGEQSLTRLFGRAMSWYEEYAFLNGLGIGNSQPLGILNANSKKDVTRQIAGHIGADDVSRMLSRMIPFGFNNAIWACSPTAMSDLSGITGYVPNVDPLGIEKGWVGSLHGRPLRCTEKLPALGTAGDLIFFDPSLYVVGHRQDVLITSSRQAPEVFSRNQTMFQVWARTAGQPLYGSSLTLSDQTVASPFVVLN